MSLRTCGSPQTKRKFIHPSPSQRSSARTDEFVYLCASNSEEWSNELVGSFNPTALQAHLESSRVKYLSSDKVGGQQQWLFFAEQVSQAVHSSSVSRGRRLLTLSSTMHHQKSNGTIFLVEIMVMPGQSDMTVTLKWIVNSLLYDNGHLLIMDILKYKLHQFFVQSHVSANEQVQVPAQQSYNLQQQPYQSSYQQDAVSNGKAYEEEEEEEDDDQMSARDYLAPNPVIEAAKFEQLWASSPEM